MNFKFLLCYISFDYPANFGIWFRNPFDIKMYLYQIQIQLSLYVRGIIGTEPMKLNYSQNLDNIK